jgi:ribosomal-protein-alanine N-acetyltransferase
MMGTGWFWWIWRGVMAEIPVLQTGRLVLRPFREDDAPTVARILSIPRMSEHTLRFANPYPVEMSRAWIGQHNAWAEQGLHLQWAITVLDDVLIGTVSLALEPGQSHGDLGYWVGTEFWGRGYASEAARAVVDYGFSALQLARIEAKCFTTNAASIRVLEKTGLLLERVLPGYVVDDDGPARDVTLYAISRPSQTGVDATIRRQSRLRPDSGPIP